MLGTPMFSLMLWAFMSVAYAHIVRFSSCGSPLAPIAHLHVAVVIQFVNNGLMESWSTFAIISISVSIFIGVDALYRQFVKVCIFGIDFGSAESYGVNEDDFSGVQKSQRRDPDWIAERRNQRLGHVQSENVFAGCCSSQSEMGFVPAAQLYQPTERERKRSMVKDERKRAASQKKAVRNLAYKSAVTNVAFVYAEPCRQDDDGDGYINVYATTEAELLYAKKDTVAVAGKGRGNRLGKVRFIGPDHRTGELKVGVRLFKPDGKNNGTVAGHKYFKCEDHHGILTKPENVTLVKKFTASATA